MILHLAIFRWNDGTTAEQIDAVTEALSTLPTRIDALRSYTARPNLHLRPDGADFGVAAVVDDAAGVEAYLNHPAHKEVVERFIAPIVAERTVVQLPYA